MRGKRRIDKLRNPRCGEARLISCPKCGVMPRELCEGFDGRVVATHPERQAAADALVEQNATRRFR